MLNTARNIISSDATTQEMIAPVIDTLVATKAWSVGEEFIYAGTLYKVTTAIAVGDTIVLGSGGNADTADTITEQINTKKQLVTRAIEDITAADGMIKFPSGRSVISAAAAISSTYCPVPICPVDSSQDRAYVYIDRSTTGYPTKAFSSGTTYRLVYRYIPNSF